MKSKEQQLLNIKDALAALQEEIQEAKQERLSTKAQLEKAMADGKPDSILASFTGLYNGASANLTGLQGEKRQLLKKAIVLSRSLSTGDEEIQETSPVSESSLKPQRSDKLIEACKKYLFRTEHWGCVTIIRKRHAVTYAHNQPPEMQIPGQSVNIISIQDNVQYTVKVLAVNIERDWILLISDVDLCEEEPARGGTVDGREYIQLGLSAVSQGESPFSTSKGVVSSSRLSQVGHQLGSAGANPGDSGGPCFDEWSGVLIGMNVGSENVTIQLEESLSKTYRNISSRYAARAHIVPITTWEVIESFSQK